MMARPKTGSAAVLTRFEAALEVHEYPLAAPAPGEVLVRMNSVTLCGSDLHLWSGHLPAAESLLPLVPGHEGVGTIVEFGDGVHVDSTGTPLAVGDRIVWEHESCGRCHACTVLKLGSLCRNRRVGMMTPVDRPPHLRGTLADHAYVWPGAGRLRVPDPVRSDWASAASCALRTVIKAVERLERVDYRHTVVIQGAGPLGLFATAVLATSSPALVIVIGGPAERLEIARAYGADDVIDIAQFPDPASRLEAVRDRTGGAGADVVCEFSGAPNAFVEGVDMAGPNGRYLVVGTLSGPEVPFLPQRVVSKNLTVIGSMSGEIDSYYKALRFMARYADRYEWDRMVPGPVHSLANATDAFAAMLAGTVVKPVIHP